MKSRLIAAGMATVLTLSSVSGCAKSHSAAPWGGFLNGGAQQGEFGSSLRAGLPDAEPSIGEKIKAAITPDILSGSDSESGNRGLPRVDQKTGDLAHARLLERRGEHAAAQAIYENYVRVAPQDPTPHHRLGVLAAQQTDYVRAEKHFQTAMSLAPPSAELLSDVGYLYYLMDRHAEAEGVLRQALTLDRNHEPAHNNLALVLGIQGRYDESLAEFKRCGSEAEAYASVAYVMTQRGELELAQRHYLYALQLDNTLRPAGHAVLQLLDRQRIAEQLAATRRQEEAKAAAVAAQNQPPQAFPPEPQRFPGVEIVTREAPRAPYAPQGPYNGVAPASYYAPIEQGPPR